MEQLSRPQLSGHAPRLITLFPLPLYSVITISIIPFHSQMATSSLLCFVPSHILNILESTVTISSYCSNPKSVYPADFYPSSTHEADIAHPPLSSPLVKGVAREEVLEIFKVVATRVKASFRTCARSITSATSTTPPWLPRPTFIERSRVGYAPSDVTGTRGRDGIPREGRDCQRWMCSGRGRRGESGDSSDSSCATPGFRVDSGVKKIKGRMMIPPTPLKTCNSPVQPRNPICSILSREYLVNGGDNDYILSLSFLLLSRFHFYTSISPFITRR